MDVNKTTKMLPTETLEVNADELMKEDSSQTNITESSQSGALEWKCFICDTSLTTDTSCSVFYTVLSKSGVLLNDALNKTLRTGFDAPHKMRSPVVCTGCFNIFDDLEFAEQQCTQLRKQLLTGYRKTCELYNELDKADVDGVSCQTGDVDDLDRSYFTETSEKDRAKVLCSPRKSRTKRKTTKEMEKNTAKDSSDDSDEEPIHIDYKDYEDLIKSEPDLSEEEKPKKTNSKKKYPCKQCSRSFRRPGELKNHVLVSHMHRNPNHCPTCGRKFNSRNGLYVHLKRVHHVDYEERKQLVPGLVVDVNLLEANTSDTEEFLNRSPHLSDVDDDEDMASILEEASDTPETENKPKRSQRKKKPLRSRSRSRPRKDKEPELLPEKIKIEKEEGDEEGKETVKEEEIDGTVDVETEGERKKKQRDRVGERATMPLVHECATCGKKWRTMSELTSHIATHSDLRPYVCEVCGKGYKLRRALDIHVGMHNGVHPFTCHFCNKSFTQKIGLQKHLPIHTGIARYQCDLCGKQFIHQKSFQIHKMVHSGEKAVRCNVCGLALLSSSHLRRHLRVHTGEKPYECVTCGKRFAEKYNVNAHQKVHLPPGTVTAESRGRRGRREKGGREDRSRPKRERVGQACTLCSFIPSRQISLSQHYEEHHGGNQSEQNDSMAYNVLHVQEHLSERDGPESIVVERDGQNLILTDRVGPLIPQMIIDPSGSLSYEEKPAFYPVEISMLYK